MQACIPGCEELVKHEDGSLEAKVVLKVGPVKAKFSGTVTLDTTGAPEAFSLSGQGNGGTAGHAKGGADVRLEAVAPDQTRLTYDAKAEIGGKLAQLGSRLIQSHCQETGGQILCQLRHPFRPVRRLTFLNATAWSVFPCP